jgi:hypothetical protein
MRKLLAGVLLLPVLSLAQSSPDSLKRNGYLYERFIDGAVLMHSGALEHAPLNYDVNQQAIVFEKDGQYLTLTGLEAVDTIYIDTQKFIPVNNHVYEVAVHAPVSLLIAYTGKVHSASATTEHSGTVRRNTNAVSNTVSDAYLTRRYRGDFTTSVQKQFWLKSDRLYKAFNEKQVEKVFPGKEAAIRDFVKANAINWDKEEDMIKLVEFCNRK